MKKWEYKILSHWDFSKMGDKNLKGGEMFGWVREADLLNKLGKDGWELIFVPKDAFSHTIEFGSYVFKREKK